MLAPGLLRYRRTMFRFVPFLALAAALSAPAATLEQLSLDQITSAATSIVRVRISSVSTAFSGSTIYTHYQLQTEETLKGTAPAEFVLPGGVNGHYRQSFPGVPVLSAGSEYVLFLWTSPRTGLTFPVGLSQGILNPTAQSDGSVTLSRAPIGELMLDATGRPATDVPPSTRLRDLRARIAAHTGAQK